MVSAVESLSNGLAELVESSSPAIVRVEGRRRLPATGIVWDRAGLIVTAHHVVQRERGLRVGLQDGSTVEARLVGREPAIDLAVLRAEADGLEPAPWATTDGAAVGHIVLALGRPRSSVQAALGVVSALGDAWRSPMGGGLDRYLQTDVVMYPGFSGGPLVGAGGAVLGMNTSALLRGTSIAVPTETLQRAVPELLEHGRVRRGFLGVAAQPVELPGGVRGELDQEVGLLLVGVESDSPAERAGLSLGDTIVSVDQGPVTGLDDLLRHLGGERIGQELEVRVLRGGELRSMTVTVGQRPRSGGEN